MKKFFVVLISLLLFAGTSFAACTTAFPTSAKGEFLSGIHDTADTYKIAFYTDTATYGAATTAYSATNEVSGTGYTAGGFTVADNGSTVPAPTASTSGTTGILDFTDLAPTTITFSAASTCALLYNSTESNKVIGVYNFTSIQPTAGTLTIDFPASGASTSTIRFANLWKILGVSEAYAADLRDAIVRLPSLKATGGI
jgi:hypothetical protein